MKFLLDFFPVALFFVAYKFFGIYIATGVAIGASALQLLYARFVLHKIDPLMWMSAIIVFVFGGLTLILHDPSFIKWKPTILYWSMGGTLLIGLAIFKRNFIQLILQDQIKLPNFIWLRLNFGWTVFFIAMGFLNLYVAHTYSEANWVNFKLFGTIGLTFIFVLGQALYIARHDQQTENEK